MRLDIAIAGFIKHLVAIGRSKETSRGYDLTLRAFKHYIEEKLNGQVYLDEVELSHLEGYLAFRQEQGDQAVSRNRALYIFRSFYSYLIKRDLVEKDISQKLEPITLQQKERPYLVPDEIERLIEAIDHPIIKVAVITLSYTGLRVNELTALTLKDVNLSTNCVHVRNGKGNKDRVIPINPKLKAILETYLRNTRPQVSSEQFFATQKSGRLSDQSINRWLKITTEKLGWTKHVTAHILRHSFASTLVRNNAPLPAIQNLLGHSDLRVTSRYIHQDLGQLEAAVNLI